MNARLKAVDPSNIKNFPQYEFLKQLDIGRFNSLSLTGPFDFFVTDGQRHGLFVTADHEEDIDFASALVGDKDAADKLCVSGQLKGRRELPRALFKSSFPHIPPVLTHEFGSLFGIIRPFVLPRRRIAVGICMPRVDFIRVAGMASLTLNADMHSPLRVDLSGRNTLKLNGSATTLQLFANGNCDVDGRGYYAEIAQLALYKRIRLSVNVEHRASIKLHGVGDVAIRGSRVHLERSIQGRGRIRMVSDWPRSCGPWILPPTIVS